MRPTLQVLTREQDDQLVILSPAVGLFLEYVRSGYLVRGGDLVGRLQIQDHIHDLVLPRNAEGFVKAPSRNLRRTPVEYGEELLVLDREGAEVRHDSTSGAEAEDLTGLTIKAPQSGRFYCRPAPERPSFVKPGDELHAGSVLGLIEVMKTFTEIVYGGANLPERARVVRLLVEDEEEVSRNQPLLLVEAL